jgi:hypothetical protein
MAGTSELRVVVALVITFGWNVQNSDHIKFNVDRHGFPSAIIWKKSLALEGRVYSSSSLARTSGFSRTWKYSLVIGLTGGSSNEDQRVFQEESIDSVHEEGDDWVTSFSDDDYFPFLLSAT